MKNIFTKTIEITGCDHVQHKWVSALPWKMQTVINQGLRAPDTHFCKHVKLVCRWMRGVVLQNADKDHTFMCSKKDLPSLEDIENEINYCSMHYTTHFCYALEIIAYKYPLTDKKNMNVRQIAMNYYRGIVAELLHFGIETEEDMSIRLADVGREPIKKCPVNDPYVRG